MSPFFELAVSATLLDTGATIEKPSALEDQFAKTEAVIEPFCVAESLPAVRLTEKFIEPDEPASGIEVTST